jgi:hypothetical protein
MTFLSLPMLYGSVARVCKHFCKLTRDPAVRRKVRFANDIRNGRLDLPIPTFARSFVAEAHRHLTSLSLFRRQDSNELVAAAAESCPNLKRLEVDACRALTKSTIDVLTRSPVVSQLEFVSFRKCDPYGSEPSKGILRQFLVSARNLRHLDFFEYDVLESEDMVRII